MRSKIKSHLRRAYYPFKESTLAQIRETAQGLRDKLSLALEVGHMEKLNDLGDQTEAMAVSLTSLQKSTSTIDIT